MSSRGMILDRLEESTQISDETVTVDVDRVAIDARIWVPNDVILGVETGVGDEVLIVGTYVPVHPPAQLRYVEVKRPVVVTAYVLDPKVERFVIVVSIREIAVVVLCCGVVVVGEGGKNKVGVVVGSDVVLREVAGVELAIDELIEDEISVEEAGTTGELIKVDVPVEEAGTTDELIKADVPVDKAGSVEIGTCELLEVDVKDDIENTELVVAGVGVRDADPNDRLVKLVTLDAIGELVKLEKLSEEVGVLAIEGTDTLGPIGPVSKEVKVGWMITGAELTGSTISEIPSCTFAQLMILAGSLK
ncbi:hypothetical protein MMC25_002033 [Agyrium rufum]|nr:hypothetical protein [Agyrium rufum]